MSQNLKYDGDIKIIIGDDSDKDELAFDFEGRVGKFPVSYQRHTPRLGLGGNLNWLHGVTECEIGLSLDDDHRVMQPLDITPYVERLVTDPTAGWVRLMGTASHNLNATLEGQFWRVNWATTDELYITSNRAHLFKIREWDAMYGPYPVTKFIGECEEKYCHICIDVARARIVKGQPTLDVLVPIDAPEKCWSETGHSWQMQGY